MLARPRYTHIQYKVLALLQSLPAELLSFPLDVKSIIKTIDNCNISSYESFSQKFGVTIEDVIIMCDSKTGCTHYDINRDKYLILYNSSFANYNVDGRQRWTLAHELAHVVLQHLLIETEESVAENSFGVVCNPVIETEADYFSAQILAPFPLFESLNITSPIDVEYMFGLSSTASMNQFSKYLKWKRGHIKTSFENDLIKLFSNFTNVYHF